MYKVRERGATLNALTSLSEMQHNDLKTKGALDSKFWSKSEGHDGELIKKFKQELKEHNRNRQGRMCCYCCFPLQNHKGVFDAEHILDQDSYPQFMFELCNIAAACKVCNGFKGRKPVTTVEKDIDKVPTSPDEYTIVHPHFDEWADFLEHDKAGRIIPKQNNNKGRKTIDVCGIHSLNAARLSDYFSVDKRGDVESLLRIYFRTKTPKKKLMYLDLLGKIADEQEQPYTRDIVKDLAAELEPSLLQPPMMLLNPAGQEPVKALGFDPA